MKSYNRQTLELWRAELRKRQDVLASTPVWLRDWGGYRARYWECKVCDALDGVWEAQQACVRDGWAGVGMAELHPTTKAFLMGCIPIVEVNDE